MGEQDSQEVCDSSIEASNTETARTPGPPAASSLTAPRTVSSEAAAATTLYRKQRQPVQYPRGELPTGDRNSRYPQRFRGLLGSSPRHYLGVHPTSASSRSQRQHSWALQHHSPIWGPTLHRISTSTTSPREGIRPATALRGVQSGDSTSGNPTEATNRPTPTAQHRSSSTTDQPSSSTTDTPIFFSPTAPLSLDDQRHRLPRRPTPHLPLHRPAQPARSPPPTGHPSLPIHPRISPVPTPLEPQPTDSVRTPSSHQPPGPQPSQPLP